MSLTRLLDKKSLVVLGLNSGTSADGLDMVALRFTSTKGNVRIRYLAGRRKRFDPDLKTRIHRLSDAKTVALDQLVYLDNMLGVFFGRTAASFMRFLALKGIAVDAIASHGQTVRHLPLKKKFGRYRVHGTLQLASPEQISTRTGKVVVADFRQADVALGGEGAPITVEAMCQLFADKKEPRLIVNLGGIANYFYYPAAGSRNRISAGDCGPGNVLCDLLSLRLFGERYDRNGRRALSGVASGRLLSVLLGREFFKQKDISTGREDFGPDLAEEMLAFARRFHLKREDLLATAAELTVAAICHRLQMLIRRDRSIRKLYLTGGGARNKFFMRRLKEYLVDLDVGTVKELGFDPDLVEAASFAVMGHACLRSLVMPTRFDRRRVQAIQPVPGRIVQPPQRK